MTIFLGLGRINIEAIRDLVEELTPYIKECLDRRQEKLRRMRKRDLVRLAIVRIFELMAEQRSLGKRLLDTFKKPPSTSATAATSTSSGPQSSPGGSHAHQSTIMKHLHQSIAYQHAQDEQVLRKTFMEYLEGMPFFLDQDASGSSTSDSKHQQFDLVVLTRLHFSLFIYKLIDSVQPKEKRSLLIPESMRFTLFCLCDKWAGRFSLSQHNHMVSAGTNTTAIGTLTTTSSNTTSSTASSSMSPSAQVRSSHLYMHANHHHHHNCYHYYDELELAATRACAVILCAGNTLDYMTSRSSIVYTWLTQLLEQANIEMRMYDVCKCALPNEIFMLAMNLCVQLLDLTLQYHQTQQQQQQPANNQNVTTTSSLINFVTYSPLFEWILNKCFSGVSVECADLCFIALARVYIDYLGTLTNNGRSPAKNSFDQVYLAPLLVLSILNIGSTRLNIHETSVSLLKAINKSFLQENFSTVFAVESLKSATSAVTSETDNLIIQSEGNQLPASSVGEGNVSKSSTMSSISSKSNLLKTSSLDANQQAAPIVQKPYQQPQRSNVASNFLLSTAIDIDIINSLVVHPQAQLYISEHLARKNPELTMFVILELTSRLESCLSHQGLFY